MGYDLLCIWVPTTFWCLSMYLVDLVRYSTVDQLSRRKSNQRNFIWHKIFVIQNSYGKYIESSFKSWFVVSNLLKKMIIITNYSLDVSKSHFYHAEIKNHEWHIQESSKTLGIYLKCLKWHSIPFRSIILLYSFRLNPLLSTS